MSWAPSLALDVVLAFRWASGFSPGSPALEWAGLFAANALLLKSPGACAYLVRRWLARRSFVEVGPRAVTYRRRRLAYSEWHFDDALFVEYRLREPLELRREPRGGMAVRGAALVYLDEGGTPVSPPGWRSVPPPEKAWCRIPPWFERMEEIKAKIEALAVSPPQA